MSTKTFDPVQISMEVEETKARFDVAGFDTLSAALDGIIGTGVLTLYGAVGTSLQYTSIAVLNSTNLAEIAIDIRGYSSIAAVVTTADNVNIIMHLFAARYYSNG